MTDFEKLNHSTSHLMAEAISHLYPGAKFGFGPAIEEGFYYDIDFPTPITEEDLPAIEKEMHKITAQNAKFERIEVSKEEAKKLFKDNSWALIVPIIFLIIAGERRMLIWEAGYIAFVLWLTLIPTLFLLP